MLSFVVGQINRIVFLGHSASFSTTCVQNVAKSYKIVVAGGGAGGCSVAAKYASMFGKGAVAVIEPCEDHYYQPLFTLVGAGLKPFSESRRPEVAVLPKNCDWIKDKVATFDPENCTVTTANETTVHYEYLVVALGIQLNYDQIKGLSQALETDNRVCSNYSPSYVKRTLPAIEAFKRGNAIFTFPNTPVKCAGAPQKIMYLADHYWRQNGVRGEADVMFNSSLGVIFAVRKYADRLMEVVKNRDIRLNFKHNLVEVNPDKSEAVFAKLDSEGVTETFQYDFLHVTPPMSPPDVLKDSPLRDSVGWLDVNKDTLQHVKYPNIFGIGDCTNLPTSKTAAAVACQNGVLKKNLDAAMKGQELPYKYDGYTSCPLLVGDNKCIMAEFDYEVEPLETFPFDQSRPRRVWYHMKKDVLPTLYWSFLLKGLWNGPGVARKLLHLGILGQSR